MTTYDLSMVTARLAQLELQQRHFRRLAWGGLCLLPLGLGAFASVGSGRVASLGGPQVRHLVE
jgi:hypothetical protein